MLTRKKYHGPCPCRHVNDCDIGAGEGQVSFFFFFVQACVYTYEGRKEGLRVCGNANKAFLPSFFSLYSCLHGVHGVDVCMAQQKIIGYCLD